LGGLTRSVYIDDFTYDYTGHFLHLSKFKNPSDITDKINLSEWQQIEKHSYCYYKGKFVNAPFQYNLADLGKAESEMFFLSFLEAHNNKSKKSDVAEVKLENYFKEEFGELIANEFLIPYNEKLLSNNLAKLNISGINRFFPKPDFDKIQAGALVKKGLNGPAVGYNSKFWYPKQDGISLLIKALLPKEKHVIGIPEFIDIDKKIVKIGKKDYSYTDIVSSIPLPDLMKLIRSDKIDVDFLQPDAEKLNCSSTFAINIGFSIPLPKELEDLHWLYFSEKKYTFHRIGFYSNFNSFMCPANCSSIYVEVGVDKEKVNEFNQYSVLQQVFSELGTLGFFDLSKIANYHTSMMVNAYVRFDKQWNIVVDKSRKYLLDQSILSTGRYGKWNYTSMEDSILDGKFSRY